MSKQNYEILLQTICKTGRIQLEITKSSEFSWQVALAESEQIKGSIVSTDYTKNTSSFSEEVDDTKSANNCKIKILKKNVIKLNLNTQSCNVEEYLNNVNRLHEHLKKDYDNDDLRILCESLGKELNSTYKELEGDGFKGKVYTLANLIVRRGIIMHYVKHLKKDNILFNKIEQEAKASIPKKSLVSIPDRRN